MYRDKQIQELEEQVSIYCEQIKTVQSEVVFLRAQLYEVEQKNKLLKEELALANTMTKEEKQMCLTFLRQIKCLLENS